MVYSTIKNRPFNYAKVVFSDLAAKLKEADRKKIVAYPRFLAVVLKAGLPSYPTEGNYVIPTISLKSLDAGIKDTNIRLRDVIVPDTEGPQYPQQQPPVTQAMSSD